MKKIWAGQADDDDELDDGPPVDEREEFEFEDDADDEYADEDLDDDLVDDDEESEGFDEPNEHGDDVEGVD